MSDWESIEDEVRDWQNPASAVRAKAAHERAVKAARADGFAAAREQAADFARSWEDRHPPEGWSDATITGGRIATDEVADDIRAMQDGAMSKECEGAPDCGWHNAGPCDPCKRAAKVES